MGLLPASCLSLPLMFMVPAAGDPGVLLLPGGSWSREKRGGTPSLPCCPRAALGWLGAWEAGAGVGGLGEGVRL